MDIDPAKLDPWRAYLLEYATGVLWVLSLLAFVASGRNVRSAAAWWNDTVRMAPAAHVPESFAGFALIILTIVIPYTIAVASKPISSSVMDVMQRFYSFLHHNFYSRRAEELRQRAADCIRDALGVGGVMSREMHLIYLSVQNPELGRRMQLRIDDARFRSAAALPIALFIGGLAYHAPLRLYPSTAGIAVLLSFILLAVRANRDLIGSYEELDAAVMLATDRSSKSTGDGAA